MLRPSLSWNLDARHALAGGAQLEVSLGDVGGEEAAVLRLAQHLVDDDVKAGQIFENLETETEMGFNWFTHMNT